MTARIIIGVIAGGVLGFGYYKLVGCPTVACPLTRNSWISTLYGAIVGRLAAASLH